MEIKKLKYNLKDFLWGEDSFNYSLENESNWNIKKYWELELFLLDIATSIEKKKLVDKEILTEVYFLSLSIEKAFSSTSNLNDVWNVENLGLDELEEFYDRFTHIMRIFWGRIPLRNDDHILNENPLFKGV